MTDGQAELISCVWAFACWTQDKRICALSCAILATSRGRAGRDSYKCAFSCAHRKLLSIAQFQLSTEKMRTISSFFAHTPLLCAFLCAQRHPRAHECAHDLSPPPSYQLFECARLCALRISHAKKASHWPFSDIGSYNETVFCRSPRVTPSCSFSDDGIICRSHDRGPFHGIHFHIRRFDLVVADSHF